MIAVVMGVTGSGKSTIGSALADALRCPFLDGDTLHSQANIEKMRRGEPLTDDDRRPWLEAIHARIAVAHAEGEDLVVACSALKESHRSILSGGIPITWIYLKGSPDLIVRRVRARSGHFAGADLVASQYEALEEPAGVMTVDIARSPDAIVQDIIARLQDRKSTMQIGMIGLGRMGGNMVRRLLRGGHACVVFDAQPAAAEPLGREGATPAHSLDDFVAKLHAPRVVWIMLPAAVVDDTLDRLLPLLAPEDIVVEGGNSHWVEDIRRARACGERRIHYVDVGVSGGVWGLERGYSLMIGGDEKSVAHLGPIFKALAPGYDAASPTAGRTRGTSTADEGYLHCGSAGAGHFVKMVHNGIEYGLMAAYAEGFNLMAHADQYGYDFALPDIAEVWRRGSVVGSWLLDLTATALAESGDLSQFAGHVADSGEGRWAAQAALETATPTPVLTAALFQRFASRGEDDFARRVLSAMRNQFGGHREPTDK